MARRSRQKGTICFRSGSYSLLYKVKDDTAPQGWRIKRERLEADTEPDARYEAAQFMLGINQKNMVGIQSVKSPTVKEFIDGKWVEYLRRKKRSLSTINGYKSQLNKYVIPVIGTKHLQHVTPDDIDECIKSAEAAGKADKTILNLMKLLATLFKLAGQHRYLRGESPVTPMVHAPEVDEDDVEEKPVLSAEQISQVLDVIKDRDKREGTNYEMIFSFVALTAYRAGELLALQWNNLDPTRQLIRATHHLYNGKRYKGVKTKKSKTPLKLADFLAVMLKAHRDGSTFNGADDFIFARVDGKSYDPQWLRENVLYPALEEIGITPEAGRHGFHCFRHSAATIVAEEAGQEAAMQLLRHSQMRTTQRYLHPESVKGSETLAAKIIHRQGKAKAA